MLSTKPTTPMPEQAENRAGQRRFRTPQALLRHLLDASIIMPDAWDGLAGETRDLINASRDRDELMRHLFDARLLNSYQIERVKAGHLRGLILGNYRVVGSLGCGGMGIVQAAEHILMRRAVAVKVLPIGAQERKELITRFLREMRSVARLNHPNIVSAFDAGVCPRSSLVEADLYYFVMELLEGQPLDDFVLGKTLSIAKACAFIYQVAGALDEAHRHNLVHRDIKPSNIFISSDGQAKLLDFGLVREQLGPALTSPGVVVGTPEFMAPEQAADAGIVDIRTDIFGLGGTLFFSLTGENPFNLDGTIFEVMDRRQTTPARSARAVRADVPVALDKVIGRMLALDPAERFQTPRSVMQALLPFLEGDSRYTGDNLLDSDELLRQSAPTQGKTKRGRMLVVYPDPNVRRSLARLLSLNEIEGFEAATGDNLTSFIRNENIDAVLLGFQQDASAELILKALRDNPPRPNLKVLAVSPRFTPAEVSRLLTAGADDCLQLSISNVQFIARVNTALKDKETQDRTDMLSRQLLELNSQMERNLDSRTTNLSQARNALVLALARLVEYRSTEGMVHLTRVQRYCAILGREATLSQQFADLIDEPFLQALESSAPLHDIGNVGLPDEILFKAGRLDPKERQVMQRHTLIGAETLQQVAKSFGPSVGFLGMAIDIIRHHHENYDGTGYPDNLAGNDIPLAARIMTIADNYDALRARRVQRAGFCHAAAMQIMTESSPGKFDPNLLVAFERCASQFDRVFADLPDSMSLE